MAICEGGVIKGGKKSGEDCTPISSIQIYHMSQTNLHIVNIVVEYSKTMCYMYQIFVLCITRLDQINFVFIKFTHPGTKDSLNSDCFT